MILKYEGLNMTVNNGIGGRISDAQGNIITFDKNLVLDEIIIPSSGIYKHRLSKGSIEKLDNYVQF